MENNHQETKCKCQHKDDKSEDSIALLPMLLALLSSTNNNTSLEKIQKLETRISLLEYELNGLKKLI